MMVEDRRTKAPNQVMKDRARQEARVPYDVDALLKQAPHLKVLRSAVDSRGTQISGTSDQFLEDFRRMITEDDRAEPSPKNPPKA